MHIRRMVVAAGTLLALGQIASAQLVFEFAKGPGFVDPEGADGTKAAAMFSAAVAAGAKFSSLFSDPVTLKYTLEYSPSSTPSGVLAYAASTYSAVPFPAVKTAMIADITSSTDG